MLMRKTPASAELRHHRYPEEHRLRPEALRINGTPMIFLADGNRKWKPATGWTSSKMRRITQAGI